MSGYYIIDEGQECISTGEGTFEAVMVGLHHSAIVARHVWTHSRPGLLEGLTPQEVSKAIANIGANDSDLLTGHPIPVDLVDGCMDVEIINGEKVVQELIQEWSEPLGAAIESSSWEEIDRVLRTSSSMCRSLIARVEAKGTPIDVARIIGYELGRLPQYFMRVVQQACKPSTSWFMPGLHSESMGALLYMTAQEALPHAESLEKAAQLDRAFPQAVPPAHKQRF